MTESPLLEGLRVIDLSRVLAGPYAGQLLAEMGADVIKVEPPEGDPSRGIGPHIEGRSLYFSSLNTGKRGIVLDLTADSGRRALDALLDSADILLENFRPSTARKLGVDPTDVLARHPHLTVVTVSSYARDSARAEDPALDLSVQAEAGIMSVTGEPGGPPLRAGVPVGDLTAGMLAALAAVAGYAARLRHGRGRHVEVPLLDATLSLLSYVATAAAGTGVNPPPVGSAHHSVVPYGAYPTKDGWIAVPVIGDKLWRLLCGALELDGLAGRDDLATNAHRAQRREEVDAALATALGRLTTAEAQRRLSAGNIPSAPVNQILDALATPYVAAQGIVADVAAAEGTYSMVRTPLGRGGALRPAPGLGEHTRDVLAEALGDDSPLLAAVVAG
ncbi:MAG TPA: CoA transferase [Egibacteraceae bacterium]|nr:CoA transferase [Egibacteraceae bacterium]